MAAGNTSADLDYATTGALAGTITDTALNPAVLTLAAPGAAGSLGANKALVIDTTAPTASVTAPTASQSLSGTSTVISGTASDSGLASVAVSIQRSSDSYYWTGSTWSATQTWLAATGTTSWTYTWTFNPASQNGTPSYTIQARATDNATNTGLSTSVTGVTVNNGAPTIIGVDPTGGSTAGSNTATVSGTNFTGATSVTFGTTAGTNIVVNGGGTQLTVTAPAHAAGTVHVHVTGPGGTSAEVAADQYTYSASAVPTITWLSVHNGTTAGGTSVIITGTNFTGVTGVTFGGTAGTITANTATQITATTPAHANGSVRVVVTTPGGSNADTTADDFAYTTRYEQTSSGITYYNPNSRLGHSSAPPEPSGGSYRRSLTSGSYVTISFSGTYLAWIATAGTTTGVASVTVDGVAKGTVDLARTSTNYQVNVWNTGTLTSGTHTVRFTWAAATGKYIDLDAVEITGSMGGGTPAPTVTAVSPTSGPTTGGTSVTITGTNLTGATSVTFGGTAGTITANTATQITATTPAHAAATNVQVQVTTPGGSSADVAGRQLQLRGSPRAHGHRSQRA